MLVLKIILCILFGYLVGNINPAYIIGRLRGFDIRQKGSGNAGASNALITMGKAIGVGSALFDILKAAGVYWLAPLIFGGDGMGGALIFAAEIAGVSCLVGHIFPVVMKFKGGKGLACLGGIALGMDVRFFLILIVCEFGLAFLVNYICVMPLTAAVIVPVVYGVFGQQNLGWLYNAKHGWWGAAIIAVGSLVLLSRHIQNISRLFAGTEMRFNFAWSKDKEGEVARIERNKERQRQKKLEKQARKAQK